MTESRERLVHHQVQFREVNDRIKEVANLDTGIFMCECGYPDCLSTVVLSLKEYERIRSNPIWFVVKPGHAIPENERVVSEDPGFVVVECLAVFDHEREPDARSSAAGAGAPADATRDR